jgi:SAM-dependent methyltransferase/uncharacterized membrane protein YbhN (UPF0104 family)
VTTRSPRRILLFVAPLSVGAIAAAIWISVSGGSALLEGLTRSRPWAAIAMLGLTATWLFIRFIRWQFLLRRAGARIPIRPSFGSYLAALPGTATPAYIGELARGLFIRRRFGVPFRQTTAVLVVERLLDVLALAVISMLAAPSSGFGALRVGLAFVVIAAVGWVAARRVGRIVGLEPGTVAALEAPSAVVPAFVMSLAAWAVAALLVFVGARGLGAPVSPVAGMRVFADATLLGAVTLLPAGVGATGSVAIVRLQELGLSLATAVAVVSLVRLTSTGAALVVGGGFLWRELRDARRSSDAPATVATSDVHFDEIAAEYSAQFKPHVWELLLGRKLDLLASSLPAPANAGVGLDLGCGLGIQCAEMRRRGYAVIGLDPSYGLLKHGKGEGAVMAAGSALDLPFRDGSLDFVYVIGVLHHLPGRDAQQIAYREVARVLKPGGVFLVHETNPRNPLFRFYMGYLFPMLKSIDEGTEWWLDPAHPKLPPSLEVADVRYFTFLPDFIPRALMRPALALERALEGSRLRSYSVHYMAVLRRV